MSKPEIVHLPNSDGKQPAECRINGEIILSIPAGSRMSIHFENTEVVYNLKGRTTTHITTEPDTDLG
jgi:hypothetical protein